MYRRFACVVPAARLRGDTVSGQRHTVTRRDRHATPRHVVGADSARRERRRTAAKRTRRQNNRRRFFRGRVARVRLYFYRTQVYCSQLSRCVCFAIWHGRWLNRAICRRHYDLIETGG